LRETASELRSFLAALGGEPGALEEVEAGLERIADAKRRFRAATFEELLARTEEAKAQLAAVDAGVDPADVAARALAEAETRVHALADDLHARREEAAPRFAAAVAAELAGLGLGDGEFEARLTERDPGPTGRDDVEFRIRPNPGLALAPVGQTASGGELSRIALAIAVVAGGDTLVFDELDAGIGGETANAVGRALVRAAETAQVITITHLPQIASVADRHFRVDKIPGDPTHTRIEQLSDDERRVELERMLGGAEFLETLKR
jgi:DNA repair protein RecN (Recombination protein N)